MRSWIAMRRTSDGLIVYLWPDGAITWALGAYIKGSPCPRTEEQRALALSAGWLVMGEVELYDSSDVPALISAARWVAKRGGDPGALRARMHMDPPLRPKWVTLSTDRDGTPTLQVWHLPRLRWPGLAVWRERGSYTVMREIRHTGTFEPTGFAARNLAQLRAELEKIAPTAPEHVSI